MLCQILLYYFCSLAILKPNSIGVKYSLIVLGGGNFLSFLSFDLIISQNKNRTLVVLYTVQQNFPQVLGRYYIRTLISLKLSKYKNYFIRPHTQTHDTGTPAGVQMCAWLYIIIGVRYEYSGDQMWQPALFRKELILPISLQNGNKNKALKVFSVIHIHLFYRFSIFYYNSRLDLCR